MPPLHTKKYACLAAVGARRRRSALGAFGFKVPEARTGKAQPRDIDFSCLNDGNKFEVYDNHRKTIKPCFCKLFRPV